MSAAPLPFPQPRPDRGLKQQSTDFLVTAMAASAVAYAEGKELPLNLPDAKLRSEGQALADLALANPLLHRLARENGLSHQAGRLFLHDAPWKALAERSLAAWTASQSLDISQSRPGISQRWPVAILIAGHLALRATTYLWRSEIDEVALAAPLPRHTISRDVLPHPLMFWSFEKSRGTDEFETNWMLLANAPRRAFCFFDATDAKTGDAEVVGIALPYGKVWPDEVPEDFSLAAEAVLKRCAFTRAKLVTTQRERLMRAERRELMRAGIPVDDVSVVALRRREVASSHGGGRSVDWAHKWWVAGHNRAQWYPSKQAHEVIRILPYLKGPADKPLLDKVYDVRR